MKIPKFGKGLALLLVGAIPFCGLNARADGGPTNIVETIHTNKTTTCNWKIQYDVNVIAGENGAINFLQGTNGWNDEHSFVEVGAIPEDYFSFFDWTGTTNSSANPLEVSVDRAYNLQANFLPNLTSNGTPEVWLAQYYGNTNDFESLDNSDTDEDGHRAWQEYVADTCPTNSKSVFYC